MRNNRSAAVAILGLVGALSSLHSLQAQAPAQPAPTAQPPKPLGHPCNLMSDLVPANPPSPKPPTDPSKLTLTRVDPTTKNTILNSGLPCQEIVSTQGPDKTKTPLVKPTARIRFLFLANIYRVEFFRRRASDRSIHAEHENEMGGQGKFQATSRRDVAGRGRVGVDG